MNQPRPRVAATVAFAIAALLLLGMAFELSGLERRMLTQVVGTEPFVFLPNLLRVYVSAILWVGLYALLWPIIRDTSGRRWMLAALVCWLPAVLLGTLGVFVWPRVSRIFGSMPVTAAIQILSALFALFFAVGLWRSRLFAAWLTWLGLAWAGLGIAMLAIETAVDAIVAPAPDYVASALLAVFLVGLGRELLVGGVSNKRIEQKAQGRLT